MVAFPSGKSVEVGSDHASSSVTLEEGESPHLVDFVEVPRSAM